MTPLFFGGVGDAVWMMVSSSVVFSAVPSATTKARWTGLRGHMWAARRARSFVYARTTTDDTVMGRNLAGSAASGVFGIRVVRACLRGRDFAAQHPEVSHHLKLPDRPTL